MQSSEQAVPPAESAASRLDRLRWDDLQLFANVTRCTSLRDAERRLGIPINTIRSHVDRLETSLATVLILRGRAGISLTSEGQAVLEIAQEMARASHGIPRRAGNNAVRHHGELRIGCSGGIGEYWLIPRLAALRAKLPRHRISLFSVSDDRDLDRDTLDLAISFSRPDDPDTLIARLAMLHLLPYAAPAYLERHGCPASIDALADHHYIALCASGLQTDASALILGQSLTDRVTVIRVNTSAALHHAVANGLGIGMLPSYLCAVDPQLIALALPICFRLELFLSYDPALRRSAPVRTAISWLRSCFDARVYPWFGSEFTPPHTMIASALARDLTPLREPRS